MTDVIKLSEDTIKKLKKSYQINQCIKLIADCDLIRSVSESKKILFETKIAEKFPRMWCIYDVSDFLATLQIINNPVIDLSDDKFVLIKSDDGKQVIRYIDSTEKMVNSSYMQKMPTMPSEEIQVKVPESVMKTVVTAANKLKLEFIGFISDGEKVYLKAFNMNNGDKNETNNYVVELCDNPNKNEYKMFTTAMNFACIEGDSEFSISSKKIAQAKCGDSTFVLCLDKNCEYN